jgi:hypothetical protein
VRIGFRRRSGGFEGQTGSCEGSWSLPEQRWAGGHAVWQLQLLFIGHSQNCMSVSFAACACRFRCVCEVCVDGRTAGSVCEGLCLAFDH